MPFTKVYKYILKLESEDNASNSSPSKLRLHEKLGCLRHENNRRNRDLANGVQVIKLHDGILKNIWMCMKKKREERRALVHCFVQHGGPPGQMENNPTYV